MKNISKHIDLTIIIPARNEAENLAELLPQIRELAEFMNLNFEIVVIDELADDKTRIIVKNNNSILLTPNTSGYGSAIRKGIAKANGDFIITMDADLSHPPTFIIDLWKERQSADLIIASRYIQGGKALMPISRLILSKVLNILFSRGLDLGIQDMSSGFRLYKSNLAKKLPLISKNFNIQQEILVKILAQGYRIKEIPFSYQPRRFGSSNARVIKFGLGYIATYYRLWLLRNSINSADYDARAYDSWVIIQRYWQRQRHKFIIELSEEFNQIIDIGCGSSKILGSLAQGSIGLDIKINKLRYAKNFIPDLIQGSALSLPIQSTSFSCVICSQVIEHIEGWDVLGELDRILMNGGTLILGTPDYGKWQWWVIEWVYGKVLPQAYADEHITHYTLEQLLHEFVEVRGYSLQDTRYIMQGELILALRKS